MTITQLIEIANKVYLNREVQANREAERGMKKKASLLAAALKERKMTKRQRKASHQEGESLGTPLSRDQCDYCEEKGHWKNECSNRGKAPKPGHCWEEPHGERLTGLAGTDSD